VKRTDIHRPSAIVPDDYEFVAFECVPPAAAGFDPAATSAAQAEEREIIHAHMKRTGGTYSTHEHGGNCHICGALTVWTVLFYHEKTNTYIRTGQDCANKLEMSYGSGYDSFKKNVERALEAVAGKRKAQAVLADLGLSAAWDIYLGGWQDWAACDREHQGKAHAQNTVSNIVEKLIRYGSLSEKQGNFLRTLIERIENWERVVEQRKAEHEAAAPAPSGRVTVTGTVITEKVVESDFGLTTKLLVKADEGYKVWVTRPISIEGDAKGQHIAFKATLTPSNDDPKFAFAKRPTLCKEVHNEPLLFAR